MRSQAERDAELDALHARNAVIVAELEQLPVGPALAAGLYALRAASMDCATAVRASALWIRLASWCEAESMVAVSVAVSGGELLAGAERLGVERMIGEELAAISHLTFGTAMNRVALVGQVARCMPLSWEALDRGDITLIHLKRLSDAIRAATPRVAALVEAQVIPSAVRFGWTPYELAQQAGRALLEIDPDGAANRVKAAKTDHDVRFFADPDETATIVASGPAVPMRQIMDSIDALAEKLRRDGDDRSVGQRRITAMAILILGDASQRPAIDGALTLDLTTYLGLNNSPADLPGYGPITADTARKLLAGNATLRRLITDPITGTLIDLGRTRYQPTKPLQRLINHRDRTCRFPGCHRPAVQCDKDHCTTWTQGGHTSDSNLHALCRRHHNLKTHKAWRVDRNPDGSETWTSALGFTYTKQPARYHTLVEAPEPDDIPDDPDEELLSGDPDPPRADDPLPDLPDLTLEDYFEYTDDLERRCIAAANRDYETWLGQRQAS